MNPVRLAWLLFVLIAVALLTHPLWVHGSIAKPEEMPTVTAYRAAGYVVMSVEDFAVVMQSLARAEARLANCKGD